MSHPYNFFASVMIFWWNWGRGATHCNQCRPKEHNDGSQASTFLATFRRQLQSVHEDAAILASSTYLSEFANFLLKFASFRSLGIESTSGYNTKNTQQEKRKWNTTTNTDWLRYGRQKSMCLLDLQLPLIVIERVRRQRHPQPRFTHYAFVLLLKRPPRVCTFKSVLCYKKLQPTSMKGDETQRSPHELTKCESRCTCDDTCPVCNAKLGLHERFHRTNARSSVDFRDFTDTTVRS